jgi:hypothetical protein
MENNSQIIIYQTEKGETKLEVRLENETVWLTQKLMAELFQTTVANINIHLKNIFEEGELNEAATCKDFLQVGKEGGRMVERSQKFYNLDAIISVGYRIKSAVATRFRATQGNKENSKPHKTAFFCNRKVPASVVLRCYDWAIEQRDKSNCIIAEIDTALAAHYGFTEEELNFIVNYDIKYWMRKELEGEEE